MDKKIKFIMPLLIVSILFLSSLLLFFSGCISLLSPEKRGEEFEISKKLELQLKECENIDESIFQPGVSKISCYLPLIEENRILTVCEKIKTQENVKTYCLAIVTENTSQCEELSEDYDYLRERCFMLVAESKKDLSVCDKVIDRERNYECISRVAASRKDLTLCDAIINETHEFSVCISEVAASRKDLSICDKKIDDFYERTDCYLKVAVAKKDVKVCDKIKEQKEKEGCYMNVGEELKDPKICKKIRDEVFKAQCFTQLADYLQDPTLCAELKDIDADFCYIYFILFKQDKRYLRICDKVKNEFNKAMCYSRICENIEQEYDKEECYLSLKKICDAIEDKNYREMCYSLITE